MAALFSHIRNYTEIGIVSLILILITVYCINLSFAFTPFIILVPSLGVGLVFLFYRKFELAVVVLLLSSILFLENDEGINLSELIYFTIAVVMIAFTLGSYLLKAEVLLETPFDKLAFGFVLLLSYGIILGIISGGSPSLVFGESVKYLGFLGFFAYRKHIHKQGMRKAFLAVIFIMLIYVAIRNIYHYQEILLSAYAEWQAQKARTAANEVMLLLGSIASVSYTLHTNKWYKKLIGISILVIFIGDLIITQSRGYWLAFIFAMGAVWLITDKKLKLQIIAYSLIISLIGAATAYIFLNKYFDLVFAGISNRLFSLLDLASSDIGVSLKERIRETYKVWDKITVNPIAGYGFGVTYSRYFIMDQIYVAYSYVHNGYLLLWYKFGILGLATMITYCWYILYTTYHVYQKTKERDVKIIALTIFGTLMGMLLVNITSPQFFSFDGMLILGLMGVFSSYYYKNVLRKSSTQ